MVTDKRMFCWLTMGGFKEINGISINDGFGTYRILELTAFNPRIHHHELRVETEKGETRYLKIPSEVLYAIRKGKKEVRCRYHVKYTFLQETKIQK